MAFNIVELQSFKKTFDERFEVFWNNKLRTIGKIVGDNPIVFDVLDLARSVSRDGKRLRPYLGYIGYIIARDSSTGSASDFASGCIDGVDCWDVDIIDRLIGLELFHTYALVHDDIMDRSLFRHAVPTVHIAAKKLVARGEHADHVGQSFGILAGDMLFSWAHEMLFTDLDPLILPKVAARFSKMSEEVIVGQMIDIYLSTKSQEQVLPNEIEQKNILKTARYTFVHPLIIGVSLHGGIGDEYTRFFESIGLDLGIAFQIQDDFYDIAADAEENQHTYFSIEPESFEYGLMICREKISNAKKLIEAIDIAPVARKMLLDIANAIPPDT
ncbi:MAG TPA: polyprenyl synthetase family protein [Candidatus Paceibacterota bacterium]|nr:polyprenyl synthetase family protein [Candidatus Paceibacterota bacterium]